MVDHACNAGSNFVLSLVLARWLAIPEYGAFAVAASVYWTLLAIYNELVPEPMSVLSHSTFIGQAKTYYRLLLRLHWMVSGGLSALVALAAAIIANRNSHLARALFGVAACVPFTFVYWLCRRACYARSDASTAARGGFIYALSSLGLFFAFGKPVMSNLLVYLVMGAGGSFAALFLHVRLVRTLVDAQEHSTITLREILQHHFQFARWTLPASQLHSLSSSAIAPLLAAAGGLSAAASLRAAQNFTTPLNQLLTALSMLMIPLMSQRYRQGGPKPLWRAAFLAGALLLLIGLPYALVVGVFADRLFALAYRSSSYRDDSWLVYYLLPATIIAMLAYSSNMAMRAAAAPRGVLWSKIAAATTTALLGVPLIVQRQLLGAAWAVVMIAVAEAAFSVSGLRRVVRAGGSQALSAEAQTS